MRSKALLPILLIVGLSALSCGYFQSGEWTDDPYNWKRAFRSTKPPDVVVNRSYYWRSPHWSYEFRYYFEVATNNNLRQQLFTMNKLQQLDRASATRAKDEIPRGEPSWFAPGTADTYEVWVYQDEPRGNFMVLIDKASGTMFLTDYQL